MRAPSVITALCCFLLACGPDADLSAYEAEASPGEDGADPELLTETEQALTQPTTGPGELVHWQINTDRGIRTVFPGYVPVNFVKRVRQYRFAPDLLAVQECAGFCACGPDNYSDKTKKCLAAPKKGSLLHELKELLGVEYDVVATGGNGSVIFRTSRFSQVKAMTFSSYQTGCGMTAALVLLEDRLAPSKHVAAMSEHIGNTPSCLVTRVKYADAKVAEWEAQLGVTAQLKFLSGDWNMRVDTTSSSEALRRAELQPDCWYRQLTRKAEGSCGAGASDYLDVIAAKHEADGTYSDTKPICSQFTFNNPGSTLTKAGNCNTSAGSGVLWRIDYTFVRGPSAKKENIVAALTDKGYFDVNGDGNVDGGPEKYSGHKAIYTRIRY